MFAGLVPSSVRRESRHTAEGGNEYNTLPYPDDPF